jgi:hypothetical protein
MRPAAWAASVWNRAPPARPGADLGERLDHAGLVVHRHDGDQQRRDRQGLAQHVGFEQARRPAPEEHRLEPFGGEVAHGFEDAFVLGGQGDDAPPPVAAPLPLRRSARRP